MQKGWKEGGHSEKNGKEEGKMHRDVRERENSVTGKERKEGVVVPGEGTARSSFRETHIDRNTIQDSASQGHNSPNYPAGGEFFEMSGIFHIYGENC